MSTLTPEQLAAWNAAAESLDDAPAGMSISEWMFLCGMRYQHERTREGAATLISTGDFCRYVEHAQEYCDCGLMAAAIRALTLDEC